MFMSIKIDTSSVLIVAKCIVNTLAIDNNKATEKVLIVAKCIVNYHF